MRNAGVGTSGGHAYPNKGLAKVGLQRLCEHVNKWAKNANHVSEEKAILEIFALAAFAQYHFVELHPFLDGNGRMCRYVSKYILESCLPIPFPMYTDRVAYFEALKVGDELLKDGEALKAHLPLLQFSIRSAIAYYEEILSLGTRPLYIGVTAEDICEEFKKKKTNCSSEDLTKIERAFASLEDYCSQTVQLSIGQVQLFKIGRNIEQSGDEMSNAEIDAI